MTGVNFKRDNGQVGYCPWPGSVFRARLTRLAVTAGVAAAVAVGTGAAGVAVDAAVGPSAAAQHVQLADPIIGGGDWPWPGPSDGLTGQVVTASAATATSPDGDWPWPHQHPSATA